MKRKMQNIDTTLDKYSVTYEDEYSVSIWKYDKKKTTSGPFEVEYKWKKGFDPWNQNKNEKTTKKIKKGQP